MPLSSTGLQAALAEWTTETFLECLTFDHTSLGSPIRVVNDTQDLTRSAGTFTAFPFNATLHTRSEDRISEATLVADNVDQRIVSNLRGLVGKPSVMYEIVLLDTPNTVEFGPINFEVISFLANMQTVTLRVGFNTAFLNEAFPKDWFAPWNATTT